MSANFHNICVDMNYLLPTFVKVISDESVYKHIRKIGRNYSLYRLLGIELEPFIYKGKDLT